MRTLVARFVLAGTYGEVSPARHKVVDQVRAWGVPLDDETADGIRLVASELITNAVVHGEGPVTVALFHCPGRLVIEVLDVSPVIPQPNFAGADDESGRGLLLVDALAARTGWESSDCGKRVWADLALPKPAPSVRADVLRRFFAGQHETDVGATSQTFVLAVA
ncbi:MULTISPECIES: ATP-binding protein [unclassified Streptomyces]|uniref:ATP-binding protein n=1 Tax=unclassified Streptomyces TaxID=2593676 RepID=UPI001F34666B|nr:MULTISPECIES: ATP-binding protein [unclassified Streptomyces]